MQQAVTKLRIPLRNGLEHDILARCRKIFRHRPGTAKAVKLGYNRRLRRTARHSGESQDSD